MAGLFGISVDPSQYKGNFSEDLFWGAFYEQHLGEQYAGLSVNNQGQISIRTHRGLFRPTFESDMGGLEGTEGIGYCGHAREPFFVDTKLGPLSVCLAGNIQNLGGMVATFKKFGHTLERGDDAEVVAKLIAQENDMVSGIQRMHQEVQGSLSILVISANGVYASTAGHWPLVVGLKNGAVVVASDTAGFYNLGLTVLGDLGPGEIVCLRNGKLDRVNNSLNCNNFCSFWNVYTAFANCVSKGISASAVRKRLGAILAQKDIANGFIPDVVAPIPDSGRYHAIGYFGEFCRQINAGVISKVPLYDEVLLKYPHAGRSFTPLTKAERDREAVIKILPSSERYDGKVLVVCDDSIVRGTQTRENLVPKIKSMGFGEIHFRISNPELYSPCPWGKTTREGELLSARLPRKEDKLQELGVQGLEYNTVDDLLTVFEGFGLSRECLCIDCDLKS